MLKEIKKYYRVKNSSLAHLVGKSIHFIHAVRSGNRSFLLEELTILKRFYDALRLETPIEDISTAHYHTPKPDIIESKINKNVKALERRKQKLSDKIEQRISAERGLDTCVQLLRSSLSVEEKKWVNLRFEHLKGYLEECPIESEIVLRSQIIGLESEIKFLRDSIAL